MPLRRLADEVVELVGRDVQRVEGRVEGAHECEGLGRGVVPDGEVLLADVGVGYGAGFAVDEEEGDGEVGGREEGVVEGVGDGVGGVGVRLPAAFGVDVEGVLGGRGEGVLPYLGAELGGEVWELGE